MGCYSAVMDEPVVDDKPAPVAKRRGWRWWQAVLLLLLLSLLATIAVHLWAKANPPSRTITSGPFELSVFFPPVEHGRFNLPIPVVDQGYLALEEELDFLALSKQPKLAAVNEGLRLYRREGAALQPSERFRWESPNINSTVQPSFVTADGHALRSLVSEEDAEDSSDSGSTALRERRYGLTQLSQEGGPLPAPVEEYAYTEATFARSGLLRNGKYYFLLRGDTKARAYTLHAVSEDGAAEQIQELGGVHAIGRAWDGDQLTMALLDEQGAVWRLEGSPPRFVHDETLDKLGSAALAANAKSGHFCLARDFGVFGVKGGALALDRNGAQVVLRTIDTQISLPDGSKPGWQRKFQIIKIAKEMDIDPKQRNAATYQLVEQRAIALEGREAAANVVTRGRLVLLDTDLVGVVDPTYQRVNLIRYMGNAAAE